jgi:hypothetical protein
LRILYVKPIPKLERGNMEDIAPVPNDLEPTKISLLEDLLKCLDKERASLLEMRVSELWAVMEEKKAILEAIRKLPAPGPSSHPSLRMDLDRIMEEIRRRARENKDFADSSLAVFDELISIMAGKVRDQQTYGPPGTGNRPQRSPVYRRKA